MKMAVVGFALLVGLTGAARADQSGGRAHFLSGLQLYSDGHYAQALDEFRAAQLTWNDPELLLDMAECNRHLGNVAEARQQYRAFLLRAPRSPLRASVERQLARLDEAATEAPPPSELLPPAAPKPMPLMAEEAGASHAGRTAKAIGIAAWATGALATALGIYSYVEVQSLESAAHNELRDLRSANAAALSPEERAFFADPNSCAPPPSLVGGAAFARDCTRGQQFSSAATALSVVGVALGIAGTISYVVGARQAARVRERAPVELRPVVGRTGGSLQLRYTF